MCVQRPVLAAVALVFLAACPGGGAGNPDGGGGGGSDTTPPVTTASKPAGPYREALTITLECQDTGGSGCARTRYTFGEEVVKKNFGTFTGPVTVERNATLRFYSVDHAGNEEAIQERAYVIDAVPPTTSLSPPGAIQNTPLQLSITCSDVGSGCDATYFTTDGSAPTTDSPRYQAPVELAVTATVSYFSVDRAGNAEEVRSQRFIVDTQPPALSLLPSRSFSRTLALAPVCTDDDACAAVHYTLDGTAPTPESAVWAGEITLVSTTTVRAIARDRAGNLSAEAAAIYTLDDVAPITRATLGGTPWHAPTLTLTCTDDGSGCAGTSVRAGADGYEVPYSEPLAPTETTTYFFRSHDQAGNVEATKQVSIGIDHAPPTLSIYPSAGAFRADVAVTLTCYETVGSGCAGLRYTLDGSTPTASSPLYEAPLTLTATTTVKVIALDVAGNSSDVYEAKFVIDRDKPTLLASPPPGAFPGTVSLVLGCDDGAGSGCAPVKYCNRSTSYWCTPSTDYTGPLEVTSTTLLQVEVRDVAGNSESQSLGYTIDRTAPQISSVSPYDGQTIRPTDVLRVLFSEELDPASVSAATFTVDGVEGAVSVSGATITFTPAAPLPRESTFRVAVAAGVKDRVGNASAAGRAYSVHTTAAPLWLNPGSVAHLRPIGAAANATGDAVLVWRSETGSGERLWYRAHDAATGAWGEPVHLQDHRRVRAPITLPPAPTNVVAPFEDGFVVAYGNKSWRITAGTAGAPFPFWGTQADFTHDQLQVQPTAGGARAVWAASNSSYSYVPGATYDGVTWTSTSRLNPLPVGTPPAGWTGAHTPRLVSGAAGSIVLWSELGETRVLHGTAAPVAVAPVEGAQGAANDERFAVAYAQGGATYVRVGTGAEWGEAGRLDAVDGGADRILIGGGGSQFLTAYVESVGDGQVVHTRRFAADAWEAERTAFSGTEVRVEAILRRASRFGVVLSHANGDGDRTVAYLELGDDGWSTPVTLDSNAPVAGRVLATAAGEAAWVFWANGDPAQPLSVVRIDDGGVGAATPVTTDLDGASADATVTARSADGTAMAVWNEVLPTGTIGVRAARFDGENWAAPERVAEAGLAPQVAAGAHGFLVCYTGARGAHTRRFAEGVWDAAVRHPGLDAASACDVAASAEGFALTWREKATSSTSRIHAAIWRETGWEAPATLAQDPAPGAPRVARTPGGGFVAVWSNSNRSIQSRRWTTAGGWPATTTTLVTTTKKGVFAVTANDTRTYVLFDQPYDSTTTSTSVYVAWRMFDGATWSLTQRHSNPVTSFQFLRAQATDTGFITTLQNPVPTTSNWTYAFAVRGTALGYMRSLGRGDLPSAVGTIGSRALAVSTQVAAAERRTLIASEPRAETWPQWPAGVLQFEDAAGDALSPAVLGRPEGLDVLWSQENARGDPLVRDLVLQTVK